MKMKDTLSLHQVLLVTGGMHDLYRNGGVTTTELLLPGASAWTSGPRLAKGLSGARAVNSGGSVFLYGGDDNDDNQLYEVGHFRETPVALKHLCIANAINLKQGSR